MPSMRPRPQDCFIEQSKMVCRPSSAVTAVITPRPISKRRDCPVACLFALVIGLMAGPALAAATQPIACSQLFAGSQPPALTNPRLAQRTTLLCNDAYAVLASGVTHGPIWSAERPTAASVATARTTERAGRFHPDDRLPPGDRAQLEDYRGSGYDRGHMTPSGDMPDERSQQQTFSLANMVPQAAKLNRGAWAGIEMMVRDLAVQEGELFVVTGPIFQGQEIQSIGSNGVLVPTIIWKAVYSPGRGGTAAYLRKHRQTQVPGRLGSDADPGSRRGSLPCPRQQREGHGDCPAGT